MPLKMVSYKDDTNYLKNNESVSKLSCRKWIPFFINAVIIKIGIIFCLAVEFNYVPYVKHGFRCGDPSISYLYKGDAISPGLVVVVTLLSPIVLMQLSEKLRRDGGVTWRTIWSWYQGYLTSVGLFLVLGETLKVFVGELRPHFLHSCAPDAAQNCTKDAYITEFTCLNTAGLAQYLVTDSFLSFPSGHAGLAVMNCIFCVILLHSRFDTNHVSVLVKLLLMSLTPVWGFVVSISRITDHRHHWWDVLGSAVLGIVFIVYAIVYHCDSFTDNAEDTYRVCNPMPTTGNGRIQNNYKERIDARTKDESAVFM